MVRVAVVTGGTRGIGRAICEMLKEDGFTVVASYAGNEDAARRFTEDTGYTPMQWVMRARVDVARELLERSERSVEQIAADTGLGTGTTLRLHFQRILGTTPTEYRRTFSRRE